MGYQIPFSQWIFSYNNKALAVWTQRRRWERRAIHVQMYQ